MKYFTKVASLIFLLLMLGAERRTAIKNKELKANQQRIDHSAGDFYLVGDSTSTKPNSV